MNYIEFDQVYSKIEKEIMDNYDRNKAAFMLNEDILRLMYLLNLNGRTLIPNLSMGEIALCADEWEGYSLDEHVKIGLSDDQLSHNTVFRSDFLEKDIKKTYDSIVVFPPFGMSTNYGRSEAAYLEKSLKLLAPRGRLIALVPQSVTTALSFKNLREYILEEYSLEAVFFIKRIALATSV